MPQISSIETRLTKDQRAELNALIGDGGSTLETLMAYCEQEFEVTISQTAMHRYRTKVDRMGERMRRLRQFTEALAPEMSDAIKQSKQTRMLVDLVQGLLFDLVDKLETGEGADSKDIAQLGKGLADLSRTLRLSQEFEKEIRDQVAKEERLKAVEAVDAAVAGEKGLSNDTIEKIKTTILGVRPDEGA